MIRGFFFFHNSKHPGIISNVICIASYTLRYELIVCVKVKKHVTLEPIKIALRALGPNVGLLAKNFFSTSATLSLSLFPPPPPPSYPLEFLVLLRFGSLDGVRGQTKKLRAPKEEEGALKLLFSLSRFIAATTSPLIFLLYFRHTR